MPILDSFRTLNAAKQVHIENKNVQSAKHLLNP